jgi:hypothetical protein
MRCPQIFHFCEFVEAGGLMSYGVDFSAVIAKSASISDACSKAPVPATSPFASDQIRVRNQSQDRKSARGQSLGQSAIARRQRESRGPRSANGALSEWDKPAALMAGMCLPLDEYKNWLAVAVHQLTSPFAATYTAWLKDSHGKLHQLLSEPHEPVCTTL